MNGLFEVIGDLGTVLGDKTPLKGIIISVAHQDGEFTVVGVYSTNGINSKSLQYLQGAKFCPDSGQIHPHDKQVPVHHYRIGCIRLLKTSAEPEPANPP